MDPQLARVDMYGEEDEEDEEGVVIVEEEDGTLAGTCIYMERVCITNACV